MVQRGVKSVGGDLVRPFGQIRQHGEDLFDLRVGEQRRHTELRLRKPQLFLGSGSASDRRAAEGTPLSGEILALAVVGHLRPGLQFVLRPGFQVFDGYGPGADVFASRLEDGHRHLTDIVESVVHRQSAERVQLHLRIVLRLDEDSHAVLEVDDVKLVVGNDQAVPGTEAVRHIAGKIQFLLDKNDRVFADLLRRLILLHDELRIGVGAFLHLVGIVIRDRAFASHMESTLQLVFAQRMSRRSFPCRFGPRVFKLKLQPCRRRAVQPPVGAGRGQHSVISHCPAPPLSSAPLHSSQNQSRSIAPHRSSE